MSIMMSQDALGPQPRYRFTIEAWVETRWNQQGTPSARFRRELHESKHSTMKVEAPTRVEALQKVLTLLGEAPAAVQEETIGSTGRESVRAKWVMQTLGAVEIQPPIDLPAYTRPIRAILGSRTPNPRRSR